MSGGDSLAWPAPAKLNLFLHIVGRREDGYHLLQTVFQFIDLCDTLHVGLRGDGRIRRAGGLPGLDPEADLAVRAARLLQEYTGTRLGADLDIDKRIPAGGGLGGGSSDAATALWALNCLWNLHLDVDALAELGLRLGADVPVFVRGHAAWAEGVGERLSPLEPAMPWYLVVVPPVHVSTTEIFADPALTRNCQPLKIGGFLSGDHAVNVCEPVVRRRCPEVAEALEWLGAHAPARMSGTGSSIFAAFPTREAAAAVHAYLPAKWAGFVCRGMNRSPLLARVAVNCAGRMHSG
ncbi:MAG: 4-(cytidine 5'-diphospho)-2-C-methyl-D-erythritol kinase [Gammaproteobacteria bacterium]|jgi:4-diphosphocytidyl-2-C-methyl-D-erythritol kinase|nr:4-(cytidine 5'-diphospho)-2-C-methyl-D-erythritol kinase [Gammaproteobacteria bacterium]